MAGPTLVGCAPVDRQKLLLALRTAQAMLVNGVCGLGGLEGLRRCMLARLNGDRPLTVRCSECEGLPLAEGYTEGRNVGEITLCRSLFVRPQERINSVFFHELVHACNGTELDGEGLECHCFGAAATLPGRSDYRLFRSKPARQGFYLGEYLMWNPATGQVHVCDAATGLPGALLNVRFLEPRR